MNFKFNWLKGVVSVIGGTILGIAVKTFIEIKLNYCPPGAVCLEMYRTTGSVYLFITGGIMFMYIICSLIEKKVEHGT